MKKLNSNKWLDKNTPKFGAMLGANSILIVVGILFFSCCGLISAGLWLYGYANGINQEAVANMQSLTATMAQEQVVFSEVDLNKGTAFQGYVLGVEGMRAVSGEMVRGKFNDTYKSPTGQSQAGDPIPGQINAGLVVNALHEAYPDASNQAIAELAGKMIDAMRADQTKYSNFQQKRLDQARSFNTWLNGGGPNGDMLRAWILKNVWDIPGNNPNLYFYLGNDKYQGQKALDYMLRPVVSPNAIKTYQDGIQQPSIPQGNPFATAVPAAVPTKKP